jgi:hypothetical protein
MPGRSQTSGTAAAKPQLKKALREALGIGFSDRSRTEGVFQSSANPRETVHRRTRDGASEKAGIPLRMS